jgi:anionic cell wall polymer biosynthesis LytR-Cps2A-Psr (LCP) family protein
MYARSRHGRGIFDRARRQQALLMAIRDRALELGPERLRELLPALRKAVYSDLRLLDMLRLASRLSRVKRTRIHGLVLGPGQARPTTLESGQWVMVPQPQQLLLALSGLFDAGTPGLRDPDACPPMDAGLRPKKIGKRGAPAME